MKNKMPPLTPLLLLATLAVFQMACSKQKKGNEASDNDCITRAIPQVNDFQVTGAELDSIYTLFKANNLSTVNLQFNAWARDTIFTPYNGREDMVWATQFVNSLPVFQAGINYVFLAGEVLSGDVYGYTGPAPGPDTSGHQTLPNLRNSFLNRVSEATLQGGASNSPGIFPSRPEYLDVCVQATLGYLDAARLPGNYNLAPGQTLIKVWQIVPDSALSGGIDGYRPTVYVEDSTGLAWGVALIIP
jgi:hypothetical protein